MCYALYLRKFGLVNDERWGRMFVRMCPYLPFSARLCLNQHHWLANRLRTEGIDFRQCSNAFTGCAEPELLQELADELAPRDQYCLRPEVVDLLHPVLHRTRAERDRLPAPAALCLNRILQQLWCFIVTPPSTSSANGSSTTNRTIGQPNKIATIFGHKVTKLHHGKLQTEIKHMDLANPVIRSHYRNGFIKQYVRDHLSPAHRGLDQQCY